MDFNSRIEHCYGKLSDVHPEKLEQFSLSLKNDGDPQGELETWEAIAQAYVDFSISNPNCSEKERKDAFQDILSYSLGLPVENSKIDFTKY